MRATAEATETRREDALIELIAEAMWNARYSTYKWDDAAGDDAFGRRAKKNGFRRTARAAIEALDGQWYEISYVGPGDDPLGYA